MSMPAGMPPGYRPQPQPQQPVALPRWGYQASFIQKRQPAFWLFVVLLAITAVVVLGRELEFIQVRPTAWFFSIPLLILYVAPLAIAIYVLDLFEREPLGLLVAAFVWGGIIAIGFSGMTNTAWLQIIQKVMGPDFARDWGPALIGPSVEETLKGLGIVVLFLIARAEFDDIFDGFVYGAVIGLGFAAVEDLHYFVRLSEANDQIGGVLYLFFIRVISAGLYGHVLYTGLVGMGFAYFVSRRDQPYARRVQFGVGAFALAWLAHFIWNSPLFSFLIGDGSLVNWFITATVKGLPMFLAFAFLVYLAQKREARWFAYATARETGTEVLAPDEVRQLSDLRTRRAARKAVGARKGPAGEKLMGRLQREQINLAMVRTRVDSEEHPDLVRQRAVIRAVRSELAALPDLPPPLVTGGFVPGAPVAPGAPGAPASGGTSGSSGVPSAMPGQPGGQPSAWQPGAAQPWIQAGAPALPSTPGPAAVPVAPVSEPPAPAESIWAMPASAPEATAAPAASDTAIELGPGDQTTDEVEGSEGARTADVEPPPETAEHEAEAEPEAEPEATAEAGSAVTAAEPVTAEDSTAEPEPATAAAAAEHEPVSDGPEPTAAETEAQAEPGPTTTEPEPGRARPIEAEPATQPATARPAAAQPSTPVRTPSSLFAPGPSSTSAASTGTGGAQPAWQARPAAAPPSAAPVWAPTHLVPAGGMQAWATPDGSRPPIAMLAERLDLRIVERAADWARVVASNGWTGWVDGRRLIQISG